MTKSASSYVIVYQAYGKREIFYEVLFSILTLIPFLRDRDSILLLIYTDDPAFFECLKQVSHCPPFITEKLTADTIRKWQGNPPFLHRMKIKILQDCFEKHDGTLLYLDSDTAFMNSPLSCLTSINTHNFLMHQKEGTIKSELNPTLKKLHRFLKKRNYTLVVNGEPLFIPPETQMWNAGVIGLPKECAWLLDAVLAFTDTLFAQYPKHIVEQFAFSYYLRQNGNLHSCDNVIFHYWHFKEFRNILVPLFTALFKEKDLNRFYRLYSHVLPWKLIKAKQEFESLPFWKKIGKMLTGKKWHLPALDFDRLLQE